MEFSHIPVLLSQCLDGLAIDPAGIYLDGTAGGAGHSKEIAKRLTTGRLISLDQDPDAVATAAARLKGLPAQVVQANFRETARVLDELEIPFINGALLDLGVSSHQLDDAERGFSYHADAPLDMRMSQQGPTAADLVNTLDREELTRILRDYGEEPYAWQIAGKIVKAREEAPILTTLQFADLIASAMPPAERRKNKNPARRSFQAVRIAVNGELDALNEGMEAIFSRLAPGGRFCIITFHSLEDRLVKQKFRRWAQRCTCPPEQPICTCGGMPKAKLITRKPIEADAGELEENRRSRSDHRAPGAHVQADQGGVVEVAVGVLTGLDPGPQLRAAQRFRSRAVGVAAESDDQHIPLPAAGRHLERRARGGAGVQHRAGCEALLREIGMGADGDLAAQAVRASDGADHHVDLLGHPSS